jgi:hypothetical protein
MLFTTKIICWQDGEVVEYIPEDKIEATSWEEAQEICDETGRGYLTISGIWLYDEDMKGNRTHNHELN